ncbi:MAG: protein tyrosine phosphatase family protein [Polyangiaceae bacterium]
MNDAPLAEIVNVRFVGERIGSSGQPTEAQLADIAAAGYRAVINLALHDDPRYSLKDERGTVEALGMEYVHIPVVFTAPKLDEVVRFFDAMDANKDRKVWVHCAANYRVSVFLGIYRVIREGCGRDEAFAQLRSLWEPNEVWRDFIEKALATRANSG